MTLGSLQHRWPDAWSRVVACVLYKREKQSKILDTLNQTPIRQNCNETQWKWLSVKSDFVVNVDVLNRRLVTQLPKVALDYGVRRGFQ